MRIEWELPDAVVKVLAEVLEGAEHPRRMVRCDERNPSNDPYHVLNNLGEQLNSLFK